LPILDGAACYQGAIRAQVFDLSHGEQINGQVVFGEYFSDGFGYALGGTRAGSICDQNFIFHETPKRSTN
jgi:hypothetical protein